MRFVVYSLNVVHQVFCFSKSRQFCLQSFCESGILWAEFSTETNYTLQGTQIIPQGKTKTGEQVKTIYKTTANILQNASLKWYVLLFWLLKTTCTV